MINDENQNTMMKFFTAFLALSAWCINGFAQVSTLPIFPRDINDSVTVIFNTTGGNGALAGIPGPIFMHTGVVTNLSTTNTTWRYVRGTWGTNDPVVRMDSIAPNTWSKKYHIRNFYGTAGVPANEQIRRLAFVFRNTNGSIVGRAADGGDIFIDVLQVGQLGLRVTEPTSFPQIVSLNSQVNVTAISSDPCTLRVYRDNVLQTTAVNDSIQYGVNVNAVGRHWVKVEAELGGNVRVDSFYYMGRGPVNVAPLPVGVEDGITYKNDSTVILTLFAPFKQFVYVLGEMNNWEVDTPYYMNQTPDGKRYWVELKNIVPGKEYQYQYFVDGTLRVGDPYSEKISDPWNDSFIPATTYPNLIPYPNGKTSGIVSIFQTNAPSYTWQNPNFFRPLKSNLVVYELLVRDFITTRRFKTVGDSLNYLKGMGINCIHIMPIMEFEGNDSWGYNPMYFLAVDKAYGTKNDLKALIDSCHAKGIAIVLDMVLNHAFGLNPYVRLWWDAANDRPAANSPFFNPIPKHDFNVGYDFNHESPDTKYYTFRILKHWLQEFRFDGFRFDLSKGFTQNNTLGNIGAWNALDQSRVNIWKAIYDSCQAYSPGSYVILEHLSDNPEEKVLADYGMMPWGKMNDPYNEAAMGWIQNSDFNWISWKARNYQQPNLLGYMESHDEERLMVKNLQFGNFNANYSTRDTTTALERMALVASHFFTVPGPKLMWQFGEMGYDVSINFNGRTAAKPVRWNYLNDWRRLKLQKVYAALIKLKTTEPAFRSPNFQLFFSGQMKSLLITDPSMNVIALGNFGITSGNHTVNFPTVGRWYEYFTGDSINVATAGNITFSVLPGEFRIYTTKRLARPDVMTSTDEPFITNTAQLFGNYPNPFSQSTNIEFSVDEPTSVWLQVYDLQGRKVRTLVNSMRQEGHYTERWDGRDDAGQLLPNGLYVYELRAGQRYANRKLMIAR